MTNREAYKDFMKTAKASLDKIDKMKGFMTDNSPLHKKEHNNVADSIKNALIIAARCHSLKQEFFDKIQHIIDAHPEHEEYWNWLKMTSMGHL